MGGESLCIMIVMVLSSSLLSTGHKLVNTPQDCRSDYVHKWDLFTTQTKLCWTSGQVLFYPDLKCHPLNQEGPCEPGARLVYVNSSCAETKCLQYKDSSGQSCPSRNVAYRGACVDPLSLDPKDSGPGVCGTCDDPMNTDTGVCGPRLGVRLVADVWGRYKCDCSRALGFVPWYNSSCYFVHSRGPCGEGEMLVQGVEGEVGCGEVQVEVMKASLDTLNKKEILNLMMEPEKEMLHGLASNFELRTTTFGICEKDHNGTCIQRTMSPTVDVPALNFLHLMNAMFPSIYPTEDNEVAIDPDTLDNLKIENTLENLGGNKTTEKIYIENVREDPAS